MYTFAVSVGWVTTVWVCDPRHVCTLVRYFGCAMSVMSKMRIPRNRSLLTVSGTPCVPQSLRPLVDSPDTNIRLRYTETSLCAAGQTYAVYREGWLGCAMSQPWEP